MDELVEYVNACFNNIKRKRIVTGNESWILCKNVNRKKSWRTSSASAQIMAKPRFHPKKVFSKH